MIANPRDERAARRVAQPEGILRSWERQSGPAAQHREPGKHSSVVSVAITVNIVRGIGLDIGTLRSQYRRTLILSYWGSNCTTGIGTKVF